MELVTFKYYHINMAKDFKKNFGARVKHYRNLANLSQEKLAEKVGLSPHTISYIERGKNNISFTKLPVLCAALEIEPYQLFINIDNKENPDKIETINKMLKTANARQINILMNIISGILDI